MISVEVLVPQNGSLVPLLYMGVKTDPGRFGLRPHYALSPCFSLVCPRCGYTELYTVNPQALAGEPP